MTPATGAFVWEAGQSTLAKITLSSSFATGVDVSIDCIDPQIRAVCSGGIASYDPRYDKEDEVLNAGVTIMKRTRAVASNNVGACQASPVRSHPFTMIAKGYFELALMVFRLLPLGESQEAKCFRTNEREP